MQTYRFDPEIHEVVPCPLASWLRKRFPGWTVVVIHNRRNGGWSVSELFQSGTRLDDLVLLPNGPGSFTRDHVDEVDFLLNGPAADPCRQIIEGQRALIRWEQDDRDAERDARRWAGRASGERDPLGANDG